jgi:hypothetical protein
MGRRSDLVYCTKEHDHGTILAAFAYGRLLTLRNVFIGRVLLRFARSEIDKRRELYVTRMKKDLCGLGLNDIAPNA